MTNQQKEINQLKRQIISMEKRNKVEKEKRLLCLKKLLVAELTEDKENN
jgi:hypothetical protein